MNTVRCIQHKGTRSIAAKATQHRQRIEPVTSYNCDLLVFSYHGISNFEVHAAVFRLMQ